MQKVADIATFAESQEQSMKRYLIVLFAFLALLSISSCSFNSVSGPTPTVTLAPGMGRVVGVIQIRSGEKGQPVKNAILYLAKTLKDTSGNESTAAFDRVTSPKAVTDEQGHFNFSNVPPGNYGLVLDVIKASYMLKKPDSGDSMIMPVSAGTETDMGTLIYDQLPLAPLPPPYPYP